MANNLQARGTRFSTKNGAQQTTKVEKTTPSTRLAFSSDTVALLGCSLGRGAKGSAAKIVFPRMAAWKETRLAPAPP